ncbi:hypothetical protein [Ectopseudomonas composti]|uniref:hypothetical protein n=1 Tax=Ectopseudomonas composti TaxID=658457 RepID=UPI0007737258|nr:hypothetical protein [Pseudomonas composti]
MKDPDAGKYQKRFMREFKSVQQALSERGGDLQWSTHDWQCFTYREPGVSLVFYPHRGPSSRLQWIRVRNQGSKAAEALSEVLAILADKADIRTK